MSTKGRRLSRTKLADEDDDNIDYVEDEEVEQIGTDGRGRVKQYGNKAAAAYPQAPTLAIDTTVRLKAPAEGQPTGDCKIVRSDISGRYKIKDLQTGTEVPILFAESQLVVP